jgi:hypothetical protein
MMLLADIQQIFAGKWPPPPEGVSPSPVEKIFSKDLVENLAEMKERPWPEVCYGKPITERWLARNLNALGIHSKNVRIRDEQAKGYEFTDLREVFDRYIPPQMPEGGILSVPPSPTEVKLQNSIRPKTETGTAEKTAFSEGMGPWDGCETSKAGMAVCDTPASAPRYQENEPATPPYAKPEIREEMGEASPLPRLTRSPEPGQDEEGETLI